MQGVLPRPLVKPTTWVGATYVRLVIGTQKAEPYYRESMQVFRQQAPENPLITVLFGVAIGYAMAGTIHGGSAE